MSDDRDDSMILQYLDSIERKIDTIAESVVGHDVRIRKAEAWQGNAEGKISVIATVAVFCGSAVTWLANKIYNQ